MHAVNITNASTNMKRRQHGYHTHGELIAFRKASVAIPVPLPTVGTDGEKKEGELRRHENIDSDTSDLTNLTAEAAGQWILEHTPSTFQVSHRRFGL